MQLSEVFDTDSTACLGEVLEADFCGPVCELSVRLLNAPQSVAPVLARSPGLRAPRVGARVRIRVEGLAHVLV